MMAMTDLTAERLRELVRYDPLSGEMTWRERPGSAPTDRAWNARNAGRKVGSKSPFGYLTTTVDAKAHRVHRLAWLYVHGEFPSDQLDHINGHRDDNRIGNLRSVCMKVNGKNQAMRPTNTSGVMGVSWAKATRKWHAQITVDGYNHNLGYFKSLTEATAARRSAEIRYGFHPNHGRPAAKAEARQ